MKTTQSRKHSLLSRAGLAASLAAFSCLITSFAGADDRDLLRFNTAKPYLYIILDTSASMNLDFMGDWLPAGADNPQSRLYGAKEALYDVLLPITDVQYGFATFNQDRTRVRSKHWRYAPQADSTAFLPLVYPNGEFWTLGEELDPTPFATRHVGSCAAPFDVALFDERQKVNTFPKIGEPPGSDPTTLWLSDGGITYQMVVTRTGLNTLGAATVDLLLQVSEVTACSPLTLAPVGAETITFDLVREFLIMDDNPATATEPHGDPLGGYWDYGDLLSSASCSSGAPFTGKGIESNYDSDLPPGGFDPTTDLGVTNDDQFCATGGSNSCYSVQQIWDGTAQSKNNTSIVDGTAPGSPLGLGYRALDYGDHIPLHWNVSYKDDVLARLNPNHLSGVPNFGIASYFEDERNNQTRSLRLRSPGRRPILAVGDSPIGKAVADFRCWYVGAGANKCGHLTQFDPGWETVALANDSEWGCRRPYLIVISDGEDTCAGENPCADTANLFSKAQIRTWTFVTRPDGTASPPMTCMAKNGRGELIYVTDKETLRDELNRILGEILEEARSFSSAAVPSAEAAVQDKIFTSRFVPLNGKSYWEGHLLSFLKPLPLDLEGKPDLTDPNFLWDAGTAMLSQIDPTDPLDWSATDKRRVLYSQERVPSAPGDPPGTWVEGRRLLDPTDLLATPLDPVERTISYDLWRGMEMIDSSRALVPDGSLPLLPPALPNVSQTEAAANAVIADVLAEKSHDSDGDGTDDVFYILGDVFHSDPQVLGSPSNLTYFLQDLYGDGDFFDPCDPSDKGYRCFFDRHEYRRKMAILGTNDGMMHFIDAGIFNAQRGGADEYTFDNGTGLELFAYMPREELVDAKLRAGSTNHFFGVDGDSFTTDVFIDPLHDGTPSDGDREWRTVLISSMREGGTSYFALDITQPDTIQTVSVQIDPFNTSLTEDQLHPATGLIPNCLETATGNCGPIPFASPLWEFTDSMWSPVPKEYVRLDEDANGQADLALTWSAPTTGRIRVEENGAEVDKFVAVFGGGMTQASKANPVANRGDWVYMVDVETGQTIYKEKVDGAVPNRIAAVDTDLDGYLDRLYFGTLAGKLYRADINKLASGDYPALDNHNVTDLNGLTYTVQRIDHGGEWSPRWIFDANSPGGAIRPIYHEPAVIFVGQLNLFALAFGTGDREDLWATDPEPGQFFLFVDDTEISAVPLPMNEADLVAVGADDAYTGGNHFDGNPGERGWRMQLEPNERITAKAFSISGVTVFTSYTPEIVVSAGRDPLCSKTGESRVFAVNTTNADGYFKDEFGAESRYLSLAGTTTSPYTQTTQTNNPVAVGGVIPPRPPGPSCEEILPGSKRTRQGIQVWLSRGEGGEFKLPIEIPICLLQKAWKEF